MADITICKQKLPNERKKLQDKSKDKLISKLE